jgi:predicted CxxxxCH...CXXCH cytochrome family protein
VDGTQAACGTCHGLPPPLPHVADTACDGCHLPTAGPGQTIADATTHADGVVQQGGTAGCAGCHGDDDSLAPPPDSTGETDPTERSVGAHRAHVFPSDAAEVACDECHVVPATVDDEDHIDTAPAEVTFGSLASFAAADPVWSTTTFTCSGAYCHGATLGGGDLTTPTWTATDGAAAACGACHGMPPPSPHPSSTGCSGCHPPAGPGQTIDQPARHIDGSLDL